MNVKELKEKLPEADVYEISASKRYIIQVPASMDLAQVIQFTTMLNQMGIGDEVLVLIGEVKIFELEPPNIL